MGFLESEKSFDEIEETPISPEMNQIPEVNESVAEDTEGQPLEIIDKEKDFE